MASGLDIKRTERRNRDPASPPCDAVFLRCRYQEFYGPLKFGAGRRSHSLPRTFLLAQCAGFHRAEPDRKLILK
jgi:hypothetical protein